MTHSPLFRRGSFSLRVFLYVAALLITMTTALDVVFIWMQRTNLRQQLNDRGTNRVAALANAARLPLYAGDRFAVLAAANALAAGGHVVRAVVYENDGTPFGREESERRLGPEERQVVASGLEGNVPVLVRELPGHIDFWAWISVAPQFGSDEELLFAEDSDPPSQEPHIGLARVSLSRQLLTQGYRAIVLRSSAVAAGFLLVGLCLAAWLVREANRPLRRLLAAVTVDLPEAPQGHQDLDELARLGHTYERLVERLQDAFLQLNRLNEQLEDKVAERTGQLQVANRELSRARDELEDRVRERTAQLEQAHRQVLHAEKLGAMGRLSASIAHEFNNPLFGIRNVLKELSRVPNLTADHAELVTMALGECDRMARLIRDMQAFNRPSSGRSGLVDLQEAVDTMLAFCNKDLSARGIRVERQYDPALPAVTAVEDQLKQVILNLIHNARDAMPHGGTLRVGTRPEAGHAVLHVADTGTGIPEEVRERIFEPFFTTKPPNQGTGLGLPVSHGIVAGLGGSIEVESTPGRGTRFTVRLPLHPNGTP